MIKNLIFDFNGTLLDDAFLCFKIEDEIFKRLNDESIKKITFQDYLDLFDHPVTDYYKLLGIDSKKHNYDAISQEFFVEYEARWLKESSIFPSVKETLTYFKNEGYKIYILSATEINLLKEQLTDLGIIDYFDELVASNNQDAKGKKEYGLEFALRNNFNKDNSILIGDTIHDFEASLHLNISCVLISKGHNSYNRLKDTGCDVLNDFSELKDYIKRKNG